MTTRPTSLLFFCTGNSCRSQMAEGLAKAKMPEGVAVYSAGSAPSGMVHPMAIKVMQEIGIDMSQQTSKGLGGVPPAIDLVVTVCDHAAATCPHLQGQLATEHWSIPDPVGFVGPPEEALHEYRRVLKMLQERVDTLLETHFG